MNIETIIQKQYCGAAKQLADKISQSYWNFLLKMEKCNPVELIQNYHEVFVNFDKEWVDVFQHTLKTGRSTKHILLRSIGTFSLDDFIANRFNFRINYTNYARMNYTYDKFRELALMETAMLFAKYSTVYEIELRLAILQALLQYFTVYECNALDGTLSWTFTSDDIQSVTDEILRSEVSILQPYINRIDTAVKIIAPKITEKKIKYVPKSKEELLDVIEGCNSRDDKITAIMDAYPGVKSERTADRLLSQFGLTRQYRKNMNNAEDNTSSEIESLRQENAALKEEVERLQAVIESIQNSREPKTIPIPPQVQCGASEVIDALHEQFKAIWSKLPD